MKLILGKIILFLLGTDAIKGFLLLVLEVNKLFIVEVIKFCVGFLLNFGSNKV